MSEKSESWKSSTLTVVNAEYEVAGKGRERERIALCSTTASIHIKAIIAVETAIKM